MSNVVFRECVPSKISIADPINNGHKNAESVMSPPPVPNKPPTTALRVKATKALLVPMTIVIEHGQAE